MSSDNNLWHAVHEAYETHDINEARRLLQKAPLPLACSPLKRCDDIDYIRWLLSNDLILISADDSAQWPELQELQLQCSALNEEERPACILNGEIKVGTPSATD